jgi:hypothetical protein
METTLFNSSAESGLSEAGCCSANAETVGIEAMTLNRSHFRNKGISPQFIN